MFQIFIQLLPPHPPKSCYRHRYPSLDTPIEIADADAHDDDDISGSRFAVDGDRPRFESSVARTYDVEDLINAKIFHLIAAKTQSHCNVLAGLPGSL
jgi:hypothetical protein